MKINFSSLENALQQLEVSLNYLNNEKDPNLRIQFRNSSIQCFEFTYELSFKLIRRYLDQIVSSADDLRQMVFADFIRAAARLCFGYTFCFK